MTHPSTHLLLCTAPALGAGGAGLVTLKLHCNCRALHNEITLELHCYCDTLRALHR